MFKHLPVGKKIASIFSCIVALLIAVAFLISAEIDLVRKEIVNLTDSTLPSVAQVEALRYELSTIRTGQYAILTYEDEHQAYQHIERVDRQVLMVNQMLKAYDATVITDHEQQVFDRFVQTWEVYENSLTRYNQLLNHGKRQEAHQVLAKSLDIYSALDASLSDLRQLNLNFIKKNRISIIQSVDAMLYLALGSILILAVFMIAMNIVLTRSICRPLNMLMAQSNAIASGNLTYQFARNRIGDDELGRLADTSMQMQTDLSSLIKDVSATVTQLSAAIEKVNADMDRQEQKGSALTNECLELDRLAEDLYRADIVQQTQYTRDACNELSQIANSLEKKMQKFRLV